MPQRNPLTGAIAGFGRIFSGFALSGGGDRLAAAVVARACGVRAGLGLLSGRRCRSRGRRRPVSTPKGKFFWVQVHWRELCGCGDDAEGVA